MACSVPGTGLGDLQSFLILTRTVLGGCGPNYLFTDEDTEVLENWLLSMEIGGRRGMVSAPGHDPLGQGFLDPVFPTPEFNTLLAAFV